MSKVFIVGFSEFNYTNKATGEPMKAGNLYYYTPPMGVQGGQAGSIFVQDKTELMTKCRMRGDYNKPVEAELQYSLMNGNPRLIGVNFLDNK